MSTSDICRRRRDIDTARGCGIILILLHHTAQYFNEFCPRSFNATVSGTIVTIASYMNVPCFILLAGICFGFGQKPLNSLADYIVFERKKLYRLLLPYITVSLLQAAIKIAVLRRGTSDILQELINSAIVPQYGAAGHLWFLYCLMSLFLIYPLIRHAASRRPLPILWIVLLILAILPISWPRHGSLFGLGNLVRYLPLFAVGYWYSGSGLLNKQPGPIAFLIAADILFMALFWKFFVSLPPGFIIDILNRAVQWCGFVAGGILVLWSSQIIISRYNKLSKVLQIIGFYSYDIYLLHVAFVGHPLAFITGKLGVESIFVIFVMFVLTIFAEILVPIGMSKLIRMSAKIAFLLLGVPLNGKRNGASDRNALRPGS